MQFVQDFDGTLYTTNASEIHQNNGLCGKIVDSKIKNECGPSNIQGHEDDT